MQTSDEAAKTICDLMEFNERRLGTIKEATAAMHELMDAVRATGKNGTVTLKFSVKPDKNDELALMITADVATSIPKPERRAALVYHDSENRAFTKTDPRQLELLAEREAERQEREAELREKGIALVGRGPQAATA
jgi:hypothetical protein